ncbi:hypothetical protein MVEN_02235500 [Mycena venus]|uniref:Integrase core domain-containing protein n=1 Tax=Mycena venus TaxID=2733690 RepID=A0A8H6X845_9AGAR|nr:hypothetical protein MVEN_02235500 [Mycena venus]
MILHCGLNRASFIWGSPTNNTRIERLWVKVGSQFGRQWRAFFYRLEALHGLDRRNPHHLWLLHFLFLDLINDDCANFVAKWNCHPISGEGHDQSPEDMCLMGQLQHGVYVDDCKGIDPTDIRRYNGIHGPERSRAPGQTGAGQLDDEDVSAPSSNSSNKSESEDDLEAQIEEVHAENFHHEAVSVPKHANPFDDNDTMELFYDALEAAIREDIVPPGYGLLPEEWDEEGYPAFEILKSGRRGSKQLRIALPDDIWRPRAEMWGRALAILEQISYANEI